jgi:hypothetical protein
MLELTVAARASHVQESPGALSAWRPLKNQLLGTWTTVQLARLFSTSSRLCELARTSNALVFSRSTSEALMDKSGSDASSDCWYYTQCAQPSS